MTDAERAETTALIKAVNDGVTKISGLETLKAALVTDRDKQSDTLRGIRKELLNASERLERDERYRQLLIDRGYNKDGAKASDRDDYLGATEVVVEDKGVITGLKIAIGVAEQPVAALQTRIDNCNRMIESIKAQNLLMKERMSDITIAVSNGTDSGTPPTFLPIVVTAP